MIKAYRKGIFSVEEVAAILGAVYHGKFDESALKAIGEESKRLLDSWRVRT
jgi:hypothetical protein